MDIHQEDWTEFSYFGFGNYQESSKYLHEAFWTLRETYPAEPYWVHFQTVDLHGDFPAVAPFGGLYVSPEEVEASEADEERLSEGEGNLFTGRFESAGVDRVAELEPGDTLEVRCTDPGALHDIPAWCRVNGHSIVTSEERDGEIIITLKVAG